MQAEALKAKAAKAAEFAINMKKDKEEQDLLAMASPAKSETRS